MWRALPINTFVRNTNGFIINTGNTHKCRHPQVYPDTFALQVRWNPTPVTRTLLLFGSLCNVQNNLKTVVMWSDAVFFFFVLFYSSPSDLWFMFISDSCLHYENITSDLWKSSAPRLLFSVFALGQTEALKWRFWRSSNCMSCKKLSQNWVLTVHCFYNTNRPFHHPSLSDNPRISYALLN